MQRVQAAEGKSERERGLPHAIPPADLPSGPGATPFKSHSLFFTVGTPCANELQIAVLHSYDVISFKLRPRHALAVVG